MRSIIGSTPTLWGEPWACATHRMTTTSGPPTTRQQIQEPFIREMEIDPSLYYPEGYAPILLQDWPARKPLFIPDSLIPRAMKPPQGRGN